MQLALFTQDSYRVEAVEQAMAGQGWRLLAAVAQSRPLEWLQQRPAADVILLDLDLPGALSLVEDLTHTFAGVPLLALADPNRLVDLQQALLKGVVAFVLYPIDPPQFVATVQRVVHLRGPHRAEVQRGGHLIAVAGLKGGVGRTTLAVNLAVALAQRFPEDVILAEVHGGLSDVSLLLNAHPGRTLVNLAQEVTVDADVVTGYLHFHSSGVRMLAAPETLGQRSDLDPATWQQVLSLSTGLVSVVVADTSQTPDAVLSEVLALADDILVVTNPDMASLRGAVVLIETLRQDSNLRGNIHLVLNREGLEGGITAKSIDARFGQKVDAVLCDDAALVTYACNRGTPFVLSHPRALLSRQVFKLADQLVAAAPAAPAPAGASKRRGFFRRQG